MDGYTQISYNELFKLIFDQQTQSVSYGLLILAVFGLALITHSICLFLSKREIRKVKALDETIIIAILAYACVLLSITFFNREEGSRGTINLDTRVTQTVIKTFFEFICHPTRLPLTKLLLKNLGEVGAITASIYYILNIALFMPWGFILSVAHYKEGLIGKLLLPFLYSVITSGTIETVQLITGRGYFEVEDIITNITGGLIGAILACLVMLIIRLIKKAKNKNGGNYGFKE